MVPVSSPGVASGVSPPAVCSVEVTLERAQELKQKSRSSPTSVFGSQGEILHSGSNAPEESAGEHVLIRGWKAAGQREAQGPPQTPRIHANGSEGRGCRGRGDAKPSAS